MMKPPPTIDNARVLKVADIRDIPATGKTRHVVQGRIVEGFVALAIARYERGEGVYLFYCDAEWNVVTDTHHDDIDWAIAQAEFEFGRLKFVDVRDE